MLLLVRIVDVQLIISDRTSWTTVEKIAPDMTEAPIMINLVATINFATNTKASRRPVVFNDPTEFFGAALFESVRQANSLR